MTGTPSTTTWSVSGDTVTLQTPAGQLKVRIGPDTKIQKATGGARSDITPGGRVLVNFDLNGARSGHGTVAAASILAEGDGRPGGMARIARALADAGVNIYGHLFLGRWGDRAMFAFVVDDPDRARPILERKG